MKRILLISIKPIYAFRILDGSKTMELRKCMPKVEKDNLVIIYASAPIKAVVGYGKVGDIIKDNPENVWTNYKDSIGINKQTFNDYYKNKSTAVGIVLRDIFKLEPEIKLDSIRSEIPNFFPPQSFKYLNQHSTLKKFKKIENSSIRI